MTQQSAIDPAVFSEVQMVLAEKRTSLATLRTGIAVFALPLSVLGFLVCWSLHVGRYTGGDLLRKQGSFARPKED